MIDQGLTYFMPYESCTYPELLYLVTLRHSQQGYEIRFFKDQQQEGKFASKPELVLDYSLKSIVQAFVIPTDWTFHTKKKIDLKHEKENLYKNDQEMLDQIDERYEECTTNLLQSYDITSFDKA